MYIALTSFATKTYDIRRKQLLADNFTNQDEINEFLAIGYIKVFTGLIDIIENGQYNVENYDTANVNVEGSSQEVNNLVDEINGEVV